jgi:(p)ppGpp synthase/HD superfamily hydrolase
MQDFCMVEVLNKIKKYADLAHGDQMRKYSPERYIVHPIRVMETCRAYTNDITVLSAAVLHDVLEDTNVTKEDLGKFLQTVMNASQTSRTLMLVEELTDVYVKKDYPTWNRRKRKMKEASRIEKISEDAQAIKYADIIDNCPEITDNDPDFAERYLRECKLLLSKMKKGNKELYLKAKKTVDNCLLQLKVNKQTNRFSNRSM